MRYPKTKPRGPPGRGPGEPDTWTRTTETDTERTPGPMEDGRSKGSTESWTPPRPRGPCRQGGRLRVYGGTSGPLPLGDRLDTGVGAQEEWGLGSQTQSTPNTSGTEGPKGGGRVVTGRGRGVVTGVQTSTPATGTCDDLVDPVELETLVPPGPTEPERRNVGVSGPRSCPASLRGRPGERVAKVGEGTRVESLVTLGRHQRD